MGPSRRAIAILVAGAALAVLPALLLPEAWLVWLFFWSLLLLTMAFDLVMVPRERDITHALGLPDTLYMGEPDVLSVELAVTGSRRVLTTLKLDLSETLEPVPLQRARLGSQARTLSFRLSPKRRGMAYVETLWLRFSGPFGLIERTIRLPLDAPVDAVPNIREVRRMAFEFFSPGEFHSGLRIERYAGDGSEFDSLREFMPGLDHRAIDWKASARHGELLCRQFRAERNRQVVIAVDTGHLMAEPLDGVPRLDHAIHAGLLLSYFSVRSGDRVGFFAFDAQPQAFSEPRASMASFRSMLKISGGLEYSASETNYTLGLTHLMGKLNRRSLVVVLTDFVDTVTAELMSDNLRRLAKRHLVVFVSLRDPTLATMAAAEPRSLAKLNEAIVAESLLQERELVVTQLRRSGIFCIDAPPERIGVQLVNRYLEIKRREMIG
ncbi:MAG: hypothetical protein ACI9MR_002598 [Myxococcota bacterium]|jgi:uncharacterized protein (DUF58 family)